MQMLDSRGQSGQPSQAVQQPSQSEANAFDDDIPF